MQNKLIIIVTVLVLVLGGYYFISKQNTKNDSMLKSGETVSMEGDVQMVEESSSMPAGEKNAGVEEMTANTDSNPQANTEKSMQETAIDLEMGSFYYKPNLLTAKVGTPITIRLNSVSMVHDFNIDELNVHSPMVKNGDSYELTFTPTKAGVFEYYCSVGQHRANGQVGKITVN